MYYLQVEVRLQKHESYLQHRASALLLEEEAARLKAADETARTTKGQFGTDLC